MLYSTSFLVFYNLTEFQFHVLSCVVVSHDLMKDKIGLA